MVFGFKSKGSKAERDLINILWGSGYAAIRAAGSGIQRFPSPDILAGKKGRVLVIEVKSTKSDSKYIDGQQIEELKNFSLNFGGVGLVACKFGADWKFFSLDKLEQTKKGYYLARKYKGMELFEVEML